MDSNHRFRVNGELSRRAVSLDGPATAKGGEPDICRDQRVCMTLHWREPDSNPRSPPIAESLFATRAGTWSFGVPGCFLNTRTDSAEMDRAILSYSPPLERAILRRLTRAPTLMLHSMPVPGPWVGECSLASSRSQ